MCNTRVMVNGRAVLQNKVRTRVSLAAEQRGEIAVHPPLLLETRISLCKVLPARKKI